MTDDQEAMRILREKVESLSKQGDGLISENERLRKLLAGFVIRHDMDSEKIDRMRDALSAIEWRTATGDGLDPDETINIHVLASVGRDEISTPNPQENTQ